MKWKGSFLLSFSLLCISLSKLIEDCPQNLEVTLFLHHNDTNASKEQDFLQMNLLLGNNAGTMYLLEISVNKCEKLMIRVEEPEKCSFGNLKSSSIFVSTCKFTNDLVVLRSFQDLQTVFLPFNVAGTNIKDIVFSYFAVATGGHHYHSTATLKVPKTSLHTKGDQSTNQELRNRRAVSNEAYFIVMSHSSVYQIFVNGTTVNSFRLRNAIAVNYDYSRNLLYLMETNPPRIIQADFDGSSQIELLNHGLQTPVDLAVDWVTNKLYFTDSGLQVVGVFDPVNMYYKVLISTNIDEPYAIALDPTNSVVYWSDAIAQSIEKAAMDGTNRTILQADSHLVPQVLALDIPTQTLYWADIDGGGVESSNVDGSNRQSFLSITTSSIAVFRSYVYFTDDSSGSIYYINETEEAAIPFTTLNLESSIIELQIVDGINQPMSSNPCSPGNGNCTHLCLLSTNSAGFSCACPENFIGTNFCTPMVASPSDITNVSSTATTITLTWTQLPFEVVEQYIVTYSFIENDCGISDSNMTVEVLESPLVLTDLEENSNYSITIVTRNEAGDSLPVEISVTTSIAAPSAPPMGLEVVSTFPSNISIRWGRVLCENRNVAVTGYKITYEGTIVNYTHGTSTANRVWTVTNLLPRTSHTFEVAAVAYNSEPVLTGPTAAIRQTYFDVGFFSNGVIYPNNSVMALADIGNTNATALYCLTELLTCCRQTDGTDAGEWVVPGQTQPVSSADSASSSEPFISTRALSAVLLNCRDNTEGPAGIYTCRIPDGNGTLRTAYIGINTGTPNIIGLAYDSLTQTLTCTSTGGVVEMVTWRKNGVEVGSEFMQKQTITNTFTATYQHTLSSNDSVNLIGQFTCQIIAARGSTTDERTEVIYGLVISPPPVNISVIEYMSASLDCVVISTAPPDIEWWFTSGSQEAQLVANQTGVYLPDYSTEFTNNSLRLIIDDARYIQHHGKYTCRASVGTSFTMASAYVIVLFLSSPEISGSNEAQELSTISLTCTVQANPAPVITWLIRSEARVTVLLNSTRTNITHEYRVTDYTATSVLTIREAVLSDQGEYVCNVSNGIPTRTTNRDIIFVEIEAHNSCAEESSSCLNGGTCVDLVGSYSCSCALGFTGDNCGIEYEMNNESSTSPIIETPPRVDLISPINLTCTVEGPTALSYQWLKDGVVIPGETKKYLYIEAVEPEDRGNYTCVVIRDQEQGISSPTPLRILGIYQYTISIATNISSSELENLLLKIAGSNIETVTASVYSISEERNTEEELRLLITLYQPPGEHTTVQMLRHSLITLLESFTNITVQNIRRFDGCEPETTGDFVWPETDLGEYASTECSCSEIVGSLSGMASRYCGGDYQTGARWSNESTIDTSECAVNSQITARLCQLAANSNLTLEVVREVANITSNSSGLRAADISATVSVIDQLTYRAVSDPEVRDVYLNIVDNIQQANRSVVYVSQTVTRSSQRILDNLAVLSDLLNITQSNSEAIIYGFEKFALQLQDLNLCHFDGQTFSVNLGSVEEAMLSEGGFSEALKTSEMIVTTIAENSTATVQLQPNFFETIEECSNTTDSDVGRLSYSVFLSDILFQSRNQTENVSSIIITTRMRSAENATLMNPIMLTFRNIQEKNTSTNIRNHSCAIWDTEADDFGFWSTSFCEVKGNAMNDNLTSCQCSRHGHFVVLFDLSPPLSSQATLALSIITYIGISLSLICLISLIATYLSSKKLRTTTHPQIIMNMSLSLAGLYVCILIGGHVTSVPVLCGFTAAFHQYFMLVFFAWTAVEAIWLYLKLVRVFGTQSHERFYMIKSGIPVWALPLLIVGVCVGAGHQYYVSDFYCKAVHWPFWVGFLVPFLFLYIFDWIMFIVILISVIRHKKATPNDTKNKVKKESVIIALSLAVVFGLGWGFGLLATSYPYEGVTITFQVIFSIIVGSQGILLFVLHGIRNTDARGAWKKMWTSVAPSSKFSYAVTSATKPSNSAVKASQTFGYATSSHTLPRKLDEEDSGWRSGAKEISMSSFDFTEQDEIIKVDLSESGACATEPEKEN